MTGHHATANQFLAREIHSTTNHNGTTINITFNMGKEEKGRGASDDSNSKLKIVALGALVIGGAVVIVAVGGPTAAVAGTAAAAKVGVSTSVALLKGLAAKGLASKAVAATALA